MGGDANPVHDATRRRPPPPAAPGRRRIAGTRTSGGDRLLGVLRRGDRGRRLRRLCGRTGLADGGHVRRLPRDGVRAPRSAALRLGAGRGLRRGHGEGGRARPRRARGTVAARPGRSGSSGVRRMRRRRAARRAARHRAERLRQLDVRRRHLVATLDELRGALACRRTRPPRCPSATSSCRSRRPGWTSPTRRPPPPGTASARRAPHRSTADDPPPWFSQLTGGRPCTRRSARSTTGPTSSRRSSTPWSPNTSTSSSPSAPPRTQHCSAPGRPTSTSSGGSPSTCSCPTATPSSPTPATARCRRRWRRLPSCASRSPRTSPRTPSAAPPSASGRSSTPTTGPQTPSVERRVPCSTTAGTGRRRASRPGEPSTARSGPRPRPPRDARPRPRAAPRNGSAVGAGAMAH